jgi:ssDNA-binding Zn-finger/Zn-ribbon topoisomerase 1
MICKEVNYDLAMQEWGNLLDSGSLSKDQKSVAWSHLAGLKAEKNMAYYLAARFGGHPDLAIFNNLKVEYQGRTAQIDHLVLSRWSAYFIETKSVGHKININADGQWARVYGRKYIPMESPIEQSRRHEATLFDLLESRRDEFMGKILGLKTTFRGLIDVQHLVAVSVKAIMQGRGKKAVKDHLRPLDMIPHMIEDRHKEVKASLMVGALADIITPGHGKRSAAFTKKEFVGCCQMLQTTDISPTPLEQVHSFIGALPREAENIQKAENAAVDDAKMAEPTKATSPKPTDTAAEDAPPNCPKCGSKMALRTAKRGSLAGESFYGCTTYPKCRTIINLD